MLNFLLANFFTENGILIVLAVSLLFLFLLMVNRRKRETDYRSNLASQVKIGSRVKTYSGVYGKVLSIEETTDGKVVVLETGDDKHKSYLTVHFNAIFGIDEKSAVVLDAEGNPVLPALPDLDELERQRTEELKVKTAEIKAEEVKEKVKAEKPAVKKQTSTKSTSTAKKAPAKKPAAKKD